MSDESIEDVPQYRPGRVIRIGKAGLTTAETYELRRLLDVIADTCDAAAVVLDAAGTSPVGSQLQRLREMNDRVAAMSGRIKSVLE